MDFACRWLAKQAVCLRTVEGNFFLDNTMKSGALICICFTHFVQQCVHFAEKDKHKGVKLEHYLHKVCTVSNREALLSQRRICELFRVVAGINEIKILLE